MTEVTIGVDISKDHLDAHRLPDGASRRFTNNARGIAGFVRWLGKGPIARIVFEPTGPYHRTFERTLGERGLPLAKVNPRQVRRFAEAIGKLAKTDRIDSIVLARMGALVDPAVRAPCEPNLQDLRELRIAREALVKDRTATLNRQKTLTVALLKHQATQRLKQLEAQLLALDEAIMAAISASAALKTRYDILVTIPGISRVTAFILIIDMPELGTMTGKEAASLAGLAPVSRQSGRWKGRAFIRGGRAQLRQALYMPALVAARFNADLAAIYQRMINAGKPAKVAITALMRKLIVLANALLRDERIWAKHGA
ncbi:IS110 family RNA-guided transposase [Acuticoccus mangrovi]|uniref:IS110 family transposase n=1 Tax=Acuticoccus mangrovi TaxID=2796142 RepID=A0A934MIL4_9HYPH|nr:IS110 family transposase [Acuticoccus mangrovi]MBJ3778903.1 IS110 family transposase [Acuticoccus mangrovi]